MKATKKKAHTIKHKLIEIDGINIFYREAGDPKNPTIVMLHGFPSSSHMYRVIIGDLAENFHIVAPDYPGFGLSDTPSVDAFNYTFEAISELIEHFINALQIDYYYLMMQDYGGPIGFRIATKHPENIKGLIIQNANAYLEGLGEWPQKLANLQEAGDMEGILELKDWFMSIEGLKAMYVDGAKDAQKVDPISYLTDEALLKRKGNNDIQTALFSNYNSNFPKYHEWQTYFRNHQPPTLIIWGVNDLFFSKPGAEAFSKDLKNLETHFFDGGHFMLEEYPQESVQLIENFINKKQ